MKTAYVAVALVLVAMFAVHCGGDAPPVQDPSTTTATTPPAPSADVDAAAPAAPH